MKLFSQNPCFLSGLLQVTKFLDHKIFGVGIHMKKLNVPLLCLNTYYLIIDWQVTCNSCIIEVERSLFVIWYITHQNYILKLLGDICMFYFNLDKAVVHKFDPSALETQLVEYM